MRESWKDWPPLRGLPTDPRSTDCLTDYSTDYPTDYPYGLPLKKSTKFLLRGRKIQDAYLLQLYDHNCMKNSRHFLFRLSRPSLFHFRPILHPATCHNTQYQPLATGTSVILYGWNCLRIELHEGETKIRAGPETEQICNPLWWDPHIS